MKLVRITYENGLAAFHNQVNHKFPPGLSSTNIRSTRRINETGTCGSGRDGIFQVRGGKYQGRGGRGRFGGRGRGKSCRGYEGRENHRRSRQDDRMLQCNDGSKMEVQSSYDFANDE